MALHDTPPPAAPKPPQPSLPDIGEETPPPPRARRLRTAELFGRAQEVEIEHGRAIYRLRLTSLGKLILTK